MLKETSDKHGSFYLIKKILAALFMFCYWKISMGKKTFSYQGKNYRYFFSFYNPTLTNERAIEVPIIMDILKNYEGKKILEVGNVLSHYFPITHDIVDKYEKGKGVINQDVVDFKPNQKYDLIVSISTLEHVGWDETPRDDTKFKLAVENLTRLLKPNDGLLVVTLPLGYNEVMDKLLKNNQINFEKKSQLKRISKWNEWQETTWEQVQDAKYGSPFPAANGLVIGFIRG